MKNILTLGLGKVGTLVGVLLSKNYNVTGVDKQSPHYSFKLPFTVVLGDITDEDFLIDLIKKNDAVVSALPYFLNKKIAELTYNLGKHYFDLTEDVETTNFINIGWFRHHVRNL